MKAALSCLMMIAMAGPAFAHHETAMVAMLPGAVIWISALVAIAAAAWGRWKNRR